MSSSARTRAVVATLLITGAVVLLGAVVFVSGRQKRELRDRLADTWQSAEEAHRARVELEEERVGLERELADTVERLERSTVRRERAEAVVADVRRRLYQTQVAAARWALEGGHVAEIERYLRDAPFERRGWEWHHLELVRRLPFAPLEGPTDQVAALTGSTDGRWLAAGDLAGELWLWDRTKDIATLRVDAGEDALLSIAFAPDGTHVATGDLAGRVRVWVVDGGELVADLDGHDEAVPGIAFAAGGRHLASASEDNTVSIWDWRAGTRVRELEGHTDFVNAVAADGSGARLVSGSEDRTARVWDAATGATLAVLEGHDLGVLAVAFDAAGEHVVTYEDTGALRVFRATGGAALVERDAHDGGAPALDIDGAGRFFTGGVDGRVRVAGSVAAPGRALRLPEEYGSTVEGLVVDRDGDRLALITADLVVLSWDLAPPPACSVLALDGAGVRAVATDRDGATLAVVTTDGALGVFDALTGARLTLADVAEARATSVALSADGAALVAGYEDGAVRLFATGASAEPRTIVASGPRVVDVGIADDGSRVVAATRETLFRTWDTKSGDLLRENDKPSRSGVQHVECADDASWVASAEFDGSLRVVDPATGELVAGFLDVTRSFTTRLAYHRGAGLLVHALDDRFVQVLRVDDRDTTVTLQGLAGAVRGVDISPEGNRIAIGTLDGRVRLFATDSPDELLRIEGPGGLARCRFSRDGRRLLVGRTGAVDLWETDAAALRTWRAR